MRRRKVPDLSGMIIGTWEVLYESGGEEASCCMCRCLRCGIRKIILASKFRKGYVLRCRECRVREALGAFGTGLRTAG
jgi:hypothetical protein